MEGGRVREEGTYAELIDQDGPFAEFIRTHTGTEVVEGVPGGCLVYCCLATSDKHDNIPVHV